MTDIWGKEISPDEITLGEMIGEGMYGKVYKGLCRATKVAVKVPTRQNLSQHEIATFKKEIDIMRKITHPNVCLFMGAVAEVGNLKIVTELMKGDVEGQIFQSSNPANLLQRLKWAKDAAQGMAWLHGNKGGPCVLHRDLKPSNLLIDENGTVKVTDFGLADLIQQGAKITEVRPKGSPIYMAPEVMQRSQITIKVDVYSFGIVVWEIVKKEAAFSQHSDYTKFSKAVIEGERPPTDGLHPCLIEFMNSCWAKDPKDRPDFPTICQKLDEMMLMISTDDANARHFWGSNFNGQIHVPWKDFISKLYQGFGEQLPVLNNEHGLPAKPSDEQISKASEQQKREFARRRPDNYRKIVEMYYDRDKNSVSFLENEDFFQVALWMLFTSKEEDQVHLDHFGQVVGWLGPFGKGLLERYSNLIATEWFHGFLSKAEAEERLKPRADGTYLVRFSANNPNNYVISKKGSDGQIKHLLVLHKPGEGFVFNKTTFKTFDDLLAESTKPFRLKNPCEGSSIFKVIKTPPSPYDNT